MKDDLGGSDRFGRQPFEKRRGRGPIWVYAAAGAAFVGMIGLLLLSAGSRHSRADKYLARLRAAGEKLTYRELLGAGFEGTNEAFATVMGCQETLSGLGFSPGSIKYNESAGSGLVRVAWKQPEVESGQRGGSLGWDELRDYMGQAEESLKRVRQALNKATPQWGRGTNVFEAPTANYVAIRNCAQWLAASGLSALHEGDLEQALENLEAMGGLARANAGDYTLIGAMIRVAVAGLGLTASWQALQADEWSDAQLARMQEIWQSVDLLEALEHGFAGERAGGINLWGGARQLSNRQMRQRLNLASGTNNAFSKVFLDYVLFPAYKVTSMEADRLFYLQSMGQAISDVRDLRRGKPWDPVRSIAWHSNRLCQVPKRFWFSAMAMPNYVRAIQTTLRNETFRQLVITAIAIKRFRLECGTVPRDLAALTPSFLSSPVRDPMSGNELIYRPGDDGGFMLYSVGEDGRDDGGNPAPSTGGRPGLWGGRDWVWPVPADCGAEP